MLGRLLARQIDDVVARGRRAVALGAEMAADRWELAQLEWEEEKERVARMVVGALLALMMAVVALVFIGALVIVAFWETNWRVPAAGAVAALMVGGWIAALAFTRSQLQRREAAFAQLKRELAADLEALRERA